MRKLFTILAVFGLMLAMGSSARADQISFNLSTIANDLWAGAGDQSGGTTPLAYLVTVTVTTNVSNATAVSDGVAAGCPGGASFCAEVAFTPTDGSSTSLPGGDIPSPVWLNVNGAYSVTGNNGPDVTTGGFDTFGTMDLGSGAGKLPEVIFFLTPGTGNTKWSATTNDAANVLTPTTGYDATAYSHGFEAEVGFFANNAQIQQLPGDKTSNDAEDAGYYVPTPEPMSLLLLGGCLLVVGRKLAARLT